VNQPGEGHLHYLLNSELAPGASDTDSTTFTYKGLKEGDVIAIELVNNNHSSLVPRVIIGKSVNPGPAPAPPAAGGGAAKTPGFEPLLLAGALAALAARRRWR
jgi:hypothetical protein